MAWPRARQFIQYGPVWFSIVEPTLRAWTVIRDGCAGEVFAGRTGMRRPVTRGARVCGPGLSWAGG